MSEIERVHPVRIACYFIWGVIGLSIFLLWCLIGSGVGQFTVNIDGTVHTLRFVPKEPVPRLPPPDRP